MQFGPKGGKGAAIGGLTALDRFLVSDAIISAEASLTTPGDDG